MTKELCHAVIAHATLIDPIDYCDEEAEEGSDYCALHAAADEEPYERDDYKERLEDSMGYWDDEHSDSL